jgi:protein-L-isoaspartate(D-aspartate) O-methyltransferase
MSPAVRNAMGKVERHRLVPAAEASRAYRNHPLPIGSGQTISQPYIVALSTDLLGSRTRTAWFSSRNRIGLPGGGAGRDRLQGVLDRAHRVARRARQKRLEELGYGNIEVRIGDGYAGWPERAPFDGIVVTAAAPAVPQTLVDQLMPGGRIVIPVGGEGEVQYLKLLTKRADGSVDEKRVLPSRFVPLVPGK